MITAAKFNDGAGRVMTLMLAFGLHHHSASLVVAPLPTDFAAASGAATGAGYCELKAKLESNGRWSGGKFITWTPDTLSCQARYKLKEIPDPTHPGDTITPPFPAELWGDYDRLSC